MKLKELWLRLGPWQRFTIFVSLTLGVFLYGVVMYKAAPVIAPISTEVLAKTSQDVCDLTKDNSILLGSPKGFGIDETGEAPDSDKPLDLSLLPPTLRKVLDGKLPDDTEIYNRVDIEVVAGQKYQLLTDVSLPKSVALNVQEQIKSALKSIADDAVHTERVRLSLWAALLFVCAFALASVIDLIERQLEKYAERKRLRDREMMSRGLVPDTKEFWDTGWGRYIIATGFFVGAFFFSKIGDGWLSIGMVLIGLAFAKELAIILLVALGVFWFANMLGDIKTPQAILLGALIIAFAISRGRK